MSRVLVLGAAPLPFEPMRRQYAANLRTWHLVKALLDDDHLVCLIACRLPNTYPDGVEPMTRHLEGSFDYHSLDGPLFEDPALVQHIADGFQADAIVGVNSYPSSRAVRLTTDKPIWCDMNGWLPAEAQTKAYVYDDDRYISHFWKIEKAVLARADVLSAVSEAQAYAMVGELAARGRLGKANFGHTFVHRIPNAVTDVEMSHQRRVARGELVPEDAFVALWLGGYNTWTDVDLLFHSLSRAMAEVPSLYFVSTGGVIEGHDELTFTRFQEMCRESPHHDRFHFVGWVPTADVPNYYFESDLGLNVDSQNYETTFGARNRINEMAKAGLPVLTTLGTEISHIMAGRELALATPIGDAEAFADRLIWAAQNRKELASMAETAQAFVEEEFSYAKTTEALRQWARSPQRAPDLGVRVEFEDIDFFRQTPDGRPDASKEAETADATPQASQHQALQSARLRDYLPARVRRPLGRVRRYLFGQ